MANLQKYNSLVGLMMHFSDEKVCLECNDISISQKSAWHMLHTISEMVKAKNASLILDPDADYAD